MEFPNYKEKQTLINKALMKYFAEDDYPEVIYDAMRYSVHSGGKRFRSVLCLFCYEIFKSDFETALPSAIALEFVHSYSLIHDDLPAIDNDDLRRGNPTLHKKYGEDIAILAGDGLYAEAFKVIAMDQKGDAEKIKKVIGELALASGPKGMVGGQVIDVTSEDTNIDEKTLNFIHSNKTGKLIKASAVIGALLADASDSEIQIISEYAENLGLAFQITDDILDVTKTTEQLGKSAGSDTRQKKATYPSIIGIENAKEKARKHSDNAIDIIKGLDKKEDLKKLAQFVIERPN